MENEIKEVVVGSVKRCKGVCKRMRPLTEFHYKSKRRGTRQARCKECMSSYGKEHYIANTEDYKERANSRLKALRTTNRQLVKEHLATSSCSKCGNTNIPDLTISVKAVQINNLATENLIPLLAQSVCICRSCK